MKRLPIYWTAVLALTATLTCLSPRNVHAGCCDDVSAEIKDARSALIIEARVTGQNALRLDSGRIVTDVTLQVIEVFKGANQDLNTPITLRMDGGRVGQLVQFDSGHVSLTTGQDYIFRLISHRGAWRCLNARASKIDAHSPSRRSAYRKQRKAKGIKIHRRNSQLSRSTSISSTPQQVNTDTPITDSSESQTVTTDSTIVVNAPAPAGFGYNTGDDGVPARFTVCDDGSPIEYIVDTELLPPGITETQALQAVENAMAAWSDASGLKFKLHSQAIFGTAAADVASSNDQRIRIQLHNKYNTFSNSSGTLGQGGGGWIVSEGAGARVGNQEFHPRTHAYLSLNHVASAMQNLATFTQVLTHEIGHALGLSHSSENPNETNDYLSNALMYFRTNNDGRGATLSAYDDDKINLGYPAGNMPPYSFDRNFIVLTNATSAITGIGIDRLTVGGGDLETPSNLTLIVDSNSATNINGQISSTQTTIIYTTSVYSNTPIDLYDTVSFRISDGVNLSPTQTFKIIGFQTESSPSDGLPDNWMTDNFGTTTAGATGDPHHPDSDPDGDGLSNRFEYLYGTNPNDSNSTPTSMTYDHASQTVTFTTINEKPYYLEYSDDMLTWNLLRTTLGTGTPITIDVAPPANKQRLYRIKLQP